MSQSEESRQGSQAEAGLVAIKQRPPRDEAPREGARQMLLKAIETEVTDCAEAHQQEADEEGRRLVVRNGYSRERSLVAGVETPRVKAPRVADRRVDERGRKFRFTSQILPPYLRRTKSVEELIPWLYLKGISTGDFSEALAALLGPDAPGLSATTTVVRLKEVWRGEYETWSKRSPAGQRFVHVWADGIYSNMRLDDERQCLLVVIGALADGRKQLLRCMTTFAKASCHGPSCWRISSGAGSSCRRSWPWATAGWAFRRRPRKVSSNVSGHDRLTGRLDREDSPTRQGWSASRQVGRDAG